MEVEACPELVADLIQRSVDVGLDHMDVKIEVPAVTQTTKTDPSVFYRIPRGLALWDSAVAMSTLLAENGGDINKIADTPVDLPVITDGAKVLELGAGAVPLPTIVSATLGASVVASDFQDDVLSLAARNLNSNAVDDSQCVRLDWTDPMASEALQRTYDFVMGADIISVHALYEALARTVFMASHEGTVFLLAFKERCPEKEQHFIDNLMPRFGFDLVMDVEDNQLPRIRKYGNFGHDAADGRTIKLVALQRTRTPSVMPSAVAVC